jgi:hypothetical protein
MSRALSSVEKLARQRQAAAVARSHAHLIQLKVAVVCGCTIVGALGFAMHRAGFSAMPAPAVETPGIYQGPSTVRLGEIQVPHEGETCKHYRFDNATGVIGDETTVSCTPVNIRPSLPETSRTDALMKAFRFDR